MGLVMVELGKVIQIKRNIFCKLDIPQELEMSTLYSIGLSTYMLRRLYKSSQWTPQNTVTKYRQIGLIEKIRNDEEAVRARYQFEDRATAIPTFPSTKLILDMVNLKMDKYLLHFMAVMCMTDGFVSNNEIWLTNDSKIMHNLFFDLIYYRFHLTPSSFRKNKRHNQTFYHRKENLQLISSLRNLVSSFKTTPYNEKNEEYLIQKQPSMKFLLEDPIEVQEMAFRLAMSAEGSITPRLMHGKITGTLQFAYTNLSLIKEWYQFAKNIGFSGFRLKRSSSIWSGISGMETNSVSDFRTFLKFGGFLSGVKVGKSSPYYAGLDRRSVLKALADLIDSNKVITNLNELHSDVAQLAVKYG